jgi:type VI secretion system protein ImpH
MAGTDGKSPAGLKDELLAHGPEFSFFQALRLLTLIAKSRPGSEATAVRVRPELSMAFPATDVSKISELPADQGFEITATFLGLYGVSSPLPSFYTEDLFADQRDESTATRDFADILHRRIFQLLFEAWKKYRMYIQVTEENNPVHLGLLYSLSGLSARGGEDDPNGNLTPLLRYTGLLGAHPRSALALQTMLSDYLGGAPVEIEQAVPRTVKISPDQHFTLGSEDHLLGENCVLGEEIVDRQGKFRVRIGPLDRWRFRSVLPGGENHARLTEMIRAFVVDPLQHDFELILDEGEADHATLGTPAWSRLGMDTVLFTGNLPNTLNVVFQSNN